MLGAITGDVIGSCYEFNNTKNYEFVLFPEGCAPTDDSIMTLAVAHWLMNDPEHTHQGLEDAIRKTSSLPSRQSSPVSPVPARRHLDSLPAGISKRIWVLDK